MERNRRGSVVLQMLELEVGCSDITPTTVRLLEDQEWGALELEGVARQIIDTIDAGREKDKVKRPPYGSDYASTGSVTESGLP
ncbi:hypothetical protein AKJ16_DCAP12066 [Drosera capensis]